MSKESQKEFYHQQRLKAEKSGDTATTTKIYDKLNKAKYGEGQKLRGAKANASSGDASTDDRIEKKKSDQLSAEKVVDNARYGSAGLIKTIFGGGK